MRGLTADEAEVLNFLTRPTAGDGTSRPNDRQIEILEHLITQGRVLWRYYRPGDPRFGLADGVYSITPLGRLALRVHAIASARPEATP